MTTPIENGHNGYWIWPKYRIQSGAADYFHELEFGEDQMFIKLSYVEPGDSTTPERRHTVLIDLDCAEIIAARIVEMARTAREGNSNEQ